MRGVRRKRLSDWTIYAADVEPETVAEALAAEPERVLRDSRSTLACVVVVDGRALHVKVSKARSAGWTVRHVLRRGRIWRCFLAGLRIAERKLPGIRVLAACFRWRGVFMRRAALVSDYVEASPLSDVLAAADDDAAASALRRTGSVLAAWHAAGVTHGDFKPVNLLLRSDGEVVPADYDNVRFHRGAVPLGRAAVDLSRFAAALGSAAVKGFVDAYAEARGCGAGELMFAVGGRR